MDETQTWRAVLTDGSVREVFVRFIEMTMSPGVMRWVVSSPSGRGAGFGDTRDEAISGWVRMNSDMRGILAPGEPTRAELAAQLATATASVQQLRADVELATAQRDAETCRADNTETERDEARAALVEVRRALGLRDDEDDIIGALQDEMAHRDDDEEVCRELHAADGESGPDAVRRVLQELAMAKEQIAPLAAAFDAFRAAAHAAGWRDALATGEHLVAWVRRGALREALAVARAEPGVPDGATQADFNATECAKRIAAGIEKLMGGE